MYSDIYVMILFNKLIKDKTFVIIIVIKSKSWVNYNQE